MGEISGEGILCTVEFVKDKHNHIYFDPADKIGPQVSAALLAPDKVIARAMPQGDILGFAPPFCLTQQEADTVVAATVRAVKNTWKHQQVRQAWPSLDRLVGSNIWSLSRVGNGDARTRFAALAEKTGIAAWRDAKHLR